MKADYSRILLILLLPIGDTLFTTPAIRSLRQRFPTAYIGALVFPTNKGILEANPDIDELFTYPTLQSGKDILRLPGLLALLRKRRFELAVEMSTFSLWLSRLACGIPHRLHLKFPAFWWLLPDRDPSWKITHAAYHYFSAVSPLVGDVSSLRTRIIVSASEREYASALLWEEGITEGDTLVALHPGGHGFRGRKRWPAAGFSEVADKLVQTFGAKVIILGGVDEGETARGVEMGMVRKAKAVNLVGKTTLKQTAAVIRQCDLFIGNDSSPLHIAAAVGTPVVGIFGPSNADNFRPLGAKNVTIVAADHCQPCFNFVGSNPLWQVANCRTCRCLEGVRPDDVFSAAASLLEHAELGVGV